MFKPTFRQNRVPVSPSSIPMIAIRTPARVLLLASLALAAAACDREETCANEELERIAAPGDAADAVIFQRRCGDVAELGVSLVGHDAALPDSSGNALVIRDREAGEDGAGEGVDVRWRDATAIELTYRPGRGVAHAPTEARGVHVSYRTDDVLP